VPVGITGSCEHRSTLRLDLLVTIGLAIAGLGCAPRFESMRADIDELRLPNDYVLMEEVESGDVLGFFGESPELRRQYRAPREFEPTCREIRDAASHFATVERQWSRRELEAVSVCSLSFERDGFDGGITATSPIAPDRVERMGLEERDFVRVDVRLTDRRLR